MGIFRISFGGESLCSSIFTPVSDTTDSSSPSMKSDCVNSAIQLIKPYLQTVINLDSLYSRRGVTKGRKHRKRRNLSLQDHNNCVD